MNHKVEALLDFLAGAPAGPVAEVGTLRSEFERASDGWTTVFLAQAGRKVFSIDSSSHNLSIARGVLMRRGLLDMVTLIHQDGAVALAALPPLALLYLDGSDDPVEALAQFHAAAFLPRARLAVDDAQSYGGNPFGKATAIMAELDYSGDLIETEPGYSMFLAHI